MDIKRQRQQFTKCTLYKQPTINKRHSINNLPLLANAVDASITFQESQFNHIIRIWLQGLLQNHLSVWLPFTWDKILVHFTAGTAMMLGGGVARCWCLNISQSKFVYYVQCLIFAVLSSKLCVIMHNPELEGKHFVLVGGESSITPDKVKDKIVLFGVS